MGNFWSPPASRLSLISSAMALFFPDFPIRFFLPSSPGLLLVVIFHALSRASAVLATDSFAVALAAARGGRIEAQSWESWRRWERQYCRLHWGQSTPGVRGVLIVVLHCGWAQVVADPRVRPDEDVDVVDELPISRRSRAAAHLPSWGHLCAVSVR